MAVEVIGFGNLSADLNGITFEVPLKVCKQLLVSQTKANFQAGVSPDGTAWAPLKRRRTLPRTRRKSVSARRRRTGESDKPLLDTGVLRASIVGAGEGHVEQITATELVYGTNLDYAGFHQGGTRFIPPRPFLGVTDELADKMANVFADYVAKKLGK